jgi:L-serine dehydratase
MLQIECISVFDMLKIGIGPSSSHTLGPWRAAQRWLASLETTGDLPNVTEIWVHLYGSLSLTGKGHATDYAIMLGLTGADPETIPVGDIQKNIDHIKTYQKLPLGGTYPVHFEPSAHIVFHKKFLPFHANGLKFEARMADGKTRTQTYYSIGGGFVVVQERKNARRKEAQFNTFPYPIQKGDELLAYCKREQKPISAIVLDNERSLRSDAEIDLQLKRIWATMLECMYIGCHTEGILPGGLHVKRRAFELHGNLMGDVPYTNPEEWLQSIRQTEVKFRQILQWVSCFALSVNEVNASLGRVVTAPTNGSAGVIPAVLMYYMVIENHAADFGHIKQFLLVAGEIGSIFKKGATISAAMGGCQAEIGVSSAMAAGALCELLGRYPGTSADGGRNSHGAPLGPHLRSHWRPGTGAVH